MGQAFKIELQEINSAISRAWDFLGWDTKNMDPWAKLMHARVCIFKPYCVLSFLLTRILDFLTLIATSVLCPLNKDYSLEFVTFSRSVPTFLQYLAVFSLRNLLSPWTFVEVGPS